MKKIIANLSMVSILTSVGLNSVAIAEPIEKSQDKNMVELSVVGQGSRFTLIKNVNILPKSSVVSFTGHADKRYRIPSSKSEKLTVQCELFVRTSEVYDRVIPEGTTLIVSGRSLYAGSMHLYLYTENGSKLSFRCENLNQQDSLAVTTVGEFKMAMSSFFELSVAPPTELE